MTTGAAFSVRLIEDDQLDTVLELYRQCNDFLALGPALASMEMVRKDIEVSRRQGGRFCGIWNPAGALMGVLDSIEHGASDDPNCAFLELLMIAPPFRSLGLGASVLAWLEAELRRAGIHCLEAGVQVNNPGAICFWQRHGFEITGGPTDMPDQTTVYSLRKLL